MKTELTEEQIELIKTTTKQVNKKLLNSDKINDDIAKEVITFVYSLINKPCPKIYKVVSPFAMQMKANELQGTEKEFYPISKYLSINGFYVNNEAYIAIGAITEESNPMYFKLRKFLDSNIFMSIEFENAIVICEKPLLTKFNEHRLHCEDGPAIQWEDGYCEHLINGKDVESYKNQ